MAVKMIWPISDICGRSESRGLVGKHAESARLFAGGDAACCWRAAQASHGDLLSSREWLELKLAEEADAIAKSEQRVGMPRLTGSATAAVAWGRQARHATLTSAYDMLVATDGLDDEQRVTVIVDRPRLINRTSCWTDNRDAAPADVAELVEAAQGRAAVAIENQFA